MKFKAPVVLYWIKDTSPEAMAAHFDDAAQFGPEVRMRNANHDTKDGALEAHDFVAGPDIPERYTLEKVKDINGAEIPNPNFRPMAMSFTDWVAQSRKDAELEQQIPDNNERAADATLGVDKPIAETKVKNKVAKSDEGKTAGWGTDAKA